MAEDQEPTGPSLEPPTFRRRKRLMAGTFRPPTPVAPVEPAESAEESPTTILDDVPAPSGASSDPIVSPVAPAENPFGSLDVAEPVAEPVTEPMAQPAKPPKPPKPPKVRRATPRVPGTVAAAVTGLVVGGLIVGLTDAAFGLCERVQGTDSCGGPGFFLLVAILLVSVLAGSALLRLFRVVEPGSTSFLAVGLTSVIALLFLVDALFEWWMLIVIPIVSVATYLVSHWVTATFVEQEPPVGLASEPEVVDHDVR
jgi:hypothetical protein